MIILLQQKNNHYANYQLQTSNIGEVVDKKAAMGNYWQLTTGMNGICRFKNASFPINRPIYLVIKLAFYKAIQIPFVLQLIF